MNFLVGLLVGWMLFTSSGRETFWKIYNNLDMVGDAISSGIVKDIPTNTEPTKAPDSKREKYITECRKVGFTKARCEEIWDTDDQKPMVSQVFGVKIVDIDEPEEDEL